MGSDSFLSKNIRPLTLVAVTIFLAFGSIAWGTWAMSDHKFDKIVELNLYIYLFYFGVRSMFDKNKGGLGTALKGLIGK